MHPRAPRRGLPLAVLKASLLGLALTVGGCLEAELVGERDGGQPDLGPVDLGPIDAAGACLSGPAPPDGIGETGACTLRRPPSRPIGCVDSATAIDPVVIALKDPVLGERTTGYDFDGYCSGPEGTPNGCTPNADFQPPDTADGVDNIFGVALVEGFRLIDSTIDMRAAEALEGGKLNIMLRIGGWSGEARDPRVEVTVAVAAATTPSPPLWDGVDVFQPADSFFEEGDPTRPIARDDNAYVADGILVAELPDRIPLGFDAGDGRLEIKLSQARLTVSVLGPDPYGDAVLSGRWPQAEARATAPLLGLCADSADPLIQAQRDAYLSAIDRFADIRESSADADTSLPCNALSFAVLLRGYEVQWGTPAPLTSAPPLCP